jgi:hypothetical protein
MTVLSKNIYYIGQSAAKPLSSLRQEYEEGSTTKC